MSGVVAFEGELNSIVKEYLDFNQFDKTVHMFERESTERGKPIAQSEKKPKTNQKLLQVQREMLEVFKTGRRDAFFKLWDDFLPDNIRNEDSVAQKLEFYVHIYYAVYPLKYMPNNKAAAEESMNFFKKYIETRGASLSQTTEFLPFYALPFVPNPRVHPSYKELFSETWVPDLRGRLEKFLTLALKSTPQPRLFELYNGGTRHDVQQMHGQIMEAEKRMVTYIKRYNKVQADYHNLIGITAELVDTLEATIQGQQISPEYIQQICMRLFSNQVRQTVDFTRPGTASELLRASVATASQTKKDHNMSVALDYERIRRDMTRGPERRRGLLLQALRWRLTKSAPGAQRDQNLSAFINNDLLGCASPGHHREAVLKLLTDDSEMLRQYIARLFNTFASLSEGRTYLAQNADLMKGLMSNLRSERKDSLTRENVLGCLQKLSLRRPLQTMMIEEGIIDWLVSVLDDIDSLSDYTLEYSVALLMNLCLRTAGKKKCTKNAQLVLRVLSDLLGHENQEIIPYVNGALYSILAIPSIREEAKSMGMEEILRCFIKEGQPDMNRQIEFIIKQLNSNEELDDVESDDEEEDEDEEDQDAMEADLDKAEMVKPAPKEIVGEALLQSEYVGVPSTAGKRKKPTDGVAGIEAMLTRPVTPSQRKTSDTVAPSQNAWGSRPPSQARPRSVQENMRPPTRSGSRPSSANAPSQTPIPELQTEKKSHSAGTDRAMRPSTKALEKLGNDNVDLHEYSSAFGSRPKIPRTPDVGGGRPTSRGNVGEGPTPQPKYSDSLPTPRPGSGGRSSSASNGSKKASTTSKAPTGSKTPTGGTSSRPTSRGNPK